MKYFRRMTRGKTVIMGRATLESFPGKAPLKNRVNIVITRDPARIPAESLAAAAAAQERGGKTRLVVVTSPEEALQAAAAAEPEGSLEEVYVIGGGSIYRSLLASCDTCYVTFNDCPAEADTFYPDLEADPEWICTDPGEEQVSENGTRYRFAVYRRKDL